MSPEEFRRATHVSADTLARLGRHLALLEKWNRTINLVAGSTLKDAWQRHYLDSAQLFPLLGKAMTLADLGSGAGFPGLVLAILAEGVKRGLHVHLVEADERKAAFLAEAAREAGVGHAVTIHAKRIDRTNIAGVDVVTARALAPLDALLAHAAPLLARGGRCLFLKGAKAEEEIAAARRAWRFALVRHPSLSDASGTILELGEIAPAATETPP